MQDPLAQQIALFVRYLETERRSSPRTVDTYRRTLDQLRTWAAAEGMPLDASKLSVVALRGFLASLFDTNASSTLSKKIATLRTFYRFLVRRIDVAIQKTDRDSIVFTAGKRLLHQVRCCALVKGANNVARRVNALVYLKSVTPRRNGFGFSIVQVVD